MFELFCQQAQPRARQIIFPLSRRRKIDITWSLREDFIKQLSVGSLYRYVSTSGRHMREAGARPEIVCKIEKKLH